MIKSRWFVAVTVLVVVCAIVLGVALVPPRPVTAAQGGLVPGSVTSRYAGTFNGVAYTKYTGQFVGTTAGEYAVGFEIVAPTHPAQGNGITVVETMHVMGGTSGRDAYFSPAFFYNRGFSYAGIWWHPSDVNPMVSYDAEEANQILHNFGLALRQDPAMQAMVGQVKYLYAYGVSKSSEPLLTLVASPAGTLYDLTLIVVPSWPGGTFTLDANANRVMVLNVESDRVRSTLMGFHEEALHGSSAIYRSYEIAGAPHIPDVPVMRTLSAAYGTTPEDTTPLDWTPVLRALFVAGHRWVTEGVAPPPSTYLWDGPFGQVDPLYQSIYGMDIVTGINRDTMGNALGGIRLPDLAIGRGVYIPVNPSSFFGMGLFGAFLDKQCTPLADGSPRFASHADYVAQYTAQVQALVSQGFLPSEDANALISQANASSIGEPTTCTPASQ